MKAPLFVTWTKDSNFRGCTGAFAQSEMAKTLPKYAAYSAFNDDRFDPIELKQLPQLEVSVKVCNYGNSGQGLYDWKIGEHGIIIQFFKNGRNFNATFLPEVALEQKWHHETTLKELLEKSGYTRPLEIVEKGIKLITYRSGVATLSYKQLAQK